MENFHSSWGIEARCVYWVLVLPRVKGRLSLDVREAIIRKIQDFLWNYLILTNFNPWLFLSKKSYFWLQKYFKYHHHRHQHYHHMAVPASNSWLVVCSSHQVNDTFVWREFLVRTTLDIDKSLDLGKSSLLIRFGGIVIEFPLLIRDGGCSSANECTNPPNCRFSKRSGLWCWRCVCGINI